MIAIDTNIVVRFLIEDDEAQYEKIADIFKNKELFVPDTVLLETEWVLRFAYHLSPLEVTKAMRDLLGLENVHVENGHKIAKVIDWHEEGLDFADAFHLANSIHLSTLLTFDKKFAKRASKKSTCQVQMP